MCTKLASMKFLVFIAMEPMVVVGTVYTLIIKVSVFN